MCHTEVVQTEGGPHRRRSTQKDLYRPLWRCAPARMPPAWSRPAGPAAASGAGCSSAGRSSSPWWSSQNTSTGSRSHRTRS